ncbi:MAG: type II toxin-antitoxin system death-on-curing family toxin [Burkholderiales bacterium]
MSWRWIDKRLLLVLHEETLADHGGAVGIRDETLLDSALARPLQLVSYEEADVADLAACYGWGLAHNHAFVDGNKRVAFLSVGLFLALNGYRLTATEAHATVVMVDVAAGRFTQTELAQWIRGHLTSR